jgi:hypothetical protein
LSLGIRKAFPRKPLGLKRVHRVAQIQKEQKWFLSSVTKKQYQICVAGGRTAQRTEKLDSKPPGSVS